MDLQAIKERLYDYLRLIGCRDRDDIVQDVLLKLVESYDLTRPDITNCACQLAKFAFYKSLKKQSKQGGIPLSSLQNHNDDTAEVDDLLSEHSYSMELSMDTIKILDAVDSVGMSREYMLHRDIKTMIRKNIPLDVIASKNGVSEMTVKRYNSKRLKSSKKNFNSKVLQLGSAGYNDSEIAEKLNVTPRQVGYAWKTMRKAVEQMIEDPV